MPNQKPGYDAGDPQAMVRFEKSLQVIKGRVAKLGGPLRGTLQAKAVDEIVLDLEKLIEAAQSLRDLEVVVGRKPRKPSSTPLIVGKCKPTDQPIGARLIGKKCFVV